MASVMLANMAPNGPGMPQPVIQGFVIAGGGAGKAGANDAGANGMKGEKLGVGKTDHWSSHVAGRASAWACGVVPVSNDDMWVFRASQVVMLARVIAVAASHQVCIKRIGSA